MDIVSRTPFTLKLIQRFPGYKESVGSKFSMNERKWILYFGSRRK